MRAGGFRVLICIVMVAVFFAASASVAFAGASVKWYTAGVYYDGTGRMVISGYFKNEGTVTVDRINWITLNVELVRTDGTRWLAYTDTWRNIAVVLRPGEIYRCNLRSVEMAQQFRFQGYRVYGTINYHAADLPDA